MKFAGATQSGTADGRSADACGTREAVARTVLEQGPQTAAQLAERLHVSAAAVRRHLDALVDEGHLVEREPRATARRGRGRPARTYALTDAGRAEFPHGYDDLANTALRYLAETGGDDALTAFAEHRAAKLAAGIARDLDPADPLPVRAEVMARALSAHGYASTARPLTPAGATAGTDTADSAGTLGVQVCQHHCPVAHVAAEFPQLCEAETRAFADVLGTNVQRLATIAHGDGVCTTHIPAPQVSAQPTTRSGRTAP